MIYADVSYLLKNDDTTFSKRGSLSLRVLILGTHCSHLFTFTFTRGRSYSRLHNHEVHTENNEAKPVKENHIRIYWNKYGSEAIR